jgi:hypothetical protein
VRPLATPRRLSGRPRPAAARTRRCPARGSVDFDAGEAVVGRQRREQFEQFAGRDSTRGRRADARRGGGVEHVAVDAEIQVVDARERLAHPFERRTRGTTDRRRRDDFAALFVDVVDVRA